MQMNKKLKFMLLSLLILFFVLFIFNQNLAESFLRIIFSTTRNVIHPRLNILNMFFEHIILVSASTLTATLIGLLLGVFVTRDSGRNFLALVESIISIMQTFPPAAVLALSVPALGYGFPPAFVALFIYSIFPIVSNTIAGINSVDKGITESSLAIGMSKTEILFKVELPLALRVIIAGVRTTTTINVGTATIAAVVSGGGLGSLIISGLIDNNTAYIFSGALLTAFLALVFDSCFSILESKIPDLNR